MKFAALAGIVIAMYAVPASAHHSFAVFDAEKTTNLEGTVKEFQWTNPHAWILLNVAKEGQTQEWAIGVGDRVEWAVRLGAPALAPEDADARHARQNADPSAPGRNQWRPVPGHHASRRNAYGPRRRARPRRQQLAGAVLSSRDEVARRPSYPFFAVTAAIAQAYCRPLFAFGVATWAGRSASVPPSRTLIPRPRR